MSKRIYQLPTTTDTTDKYVAVDSETGISEKILASDIRSDAENITFQATNKTGQNLTVGTPVQINKESNDNIPNFGFCQANSKLTLSNIVILAENINNNESGKVIRAGLYSNIDTSSLTEDSVYYVDENTASTVTTTEPVYPNYSCRLYKCIKSHTTDGILDVMIDADPQFGGNITVQVGGATYPVVLVTTSEGGNYTDTSSGTIMSTLFIPQNPMIINNLSIFIQQYSAFYGARMGVYQRGTSDTLIGQTEFKNSGAVGINTFTLESAVTLLPNTAYMIAIMFSVNATSIMKRSGVVTNSPNHFARFQEWFSYDYQNLGMPATMNQSQSAKQLWFGLS